MQSFRLYLKEAAGMARLGLLGQQGNHGLRLVLGNSSSDMDSVVSALTAGYYYTSTSQDGSFFVPVINCQRNDFFCNLEITVHLDDCKIAQDDLFFIDEFRSLYKADLVSEVVLVDHNKLDISQQDLSPKVTRIIDHHFDEKEYTDQLVEKECRLIGSATSLIVHKFIKDLQQFQDDFTAQSELPNLAYLLGAPIVLDSHFFKPELKDKRWTDEDT